MATHSKPISWFAQPTYGAGLGVPFMSMARPLQHVQLSGVAAVVARNILMRLPGAFPSATNQTAQIKQLAKKSGVAAETIRRILKGEVSPRLDNLDAIAQAFGITVSTLTSRNAIMEAVHIAEILEVNKRA